MYVRERECKENKYKSQREKMDLKSEKKTLSEKEGKIEESMK